mmetsp:Transcript_37448/g.116455  ORF Transcript_37448/g.116455 Transcript_37448/m.116455 type:complete len:340 (+) Transcript_37448:47-1066(+)
MADPQASLSELVTVVVTTSPSPVQPSTELIEQVLRSMVVHAPALSDARVIAVCDGCKTSEKNMWRSGRVNDEARHRYEDYKDRLRNSLGPGAVDRGLPSRCELLELPTNHGFGFAVRAALAQIATPLVCVLQHDRVFMRNVELDEVARTMLDSEGRVGYVLLPTRSTLNYVVKQSSRLAAKGMKSPDCDIDRWALPLPADGRRLLPCLTWYDSTHLCLTSYYNDFVFSSKERLVKRGGFIEGELGQLQLPEFAARGVPAALERWRTYLYDDGEEAPIVGHLNGCRYEAWDVLNEKFGAFGNGRVGRRWDGAAADGVCQAEGSSHPEQQEEVEEDPGGDT